MGENEIGQNGKRAGQILGEMGKERNWKGRKKNGRNQEKFGRNGNGRNGIGRTENKPLVAGREINLQTRLNFARSIIFCLPFA